MSTALQLEARQLLQDSLQRSSALEVFAPGRVNLIGEFTDYNDGFVLPCALPVGTAVAIAPRTDGEIVVVSRDGSRPLQDRFRIDQPVVPAESGFWGNYLRGVVAAMHEAGVAPGGADLAIVGNVPQGAGLSSSASLSVAAARALSLLPATNGRESAGSPSVDGPTLARWAQWSEHHFAGCQCGIMDQMAAATTRPGEAILLDCRSLELRQVALPADAAVLVAHSGVKRKLVAGEYNQRRSECESAAAKCGVRSLRDLPLPNLLAARTSLTDAEFRRARHVLTENTRVLEAAAALAVGDLAALGRQLRASHASLRDDFEVTIPQVDELVGFLDELIERHCGHRGGARMTGGGFGGCVMAVFESAALPALEAELREFLRPRVAGEPLLLAIGSTARTG